ncbi:MAG: MmcQ/YjbR family DNA-binding protein [Hyphomicrobium sp.]
MVSQRQFRDFALGMEGTTQTPHFDRAAFRVLRIYATLAADGKTANLKLEPDEQSLRVEMHPEAFAPVSGGWGRQGWTTVTLSKVSKGVLENALRAAWSQATQKSPSKRRRTTNKKA